MEVSPGVVLSVVWGFGLAGASVSGRRAWGWTPTAAGAAALSEVGFAPRLIFLPARRVWVASWGCWWAPVVCLSPTRAVVALGRVATFCPGVICSIKQQMSHKSFSVTKFNWKAPAVIRSWNRQPHKTLQRETNGSLCAYFLWCREVLPLWAWLCWECAESLLWAGEWELLVWPLWLPLLPDIWLTELPTAVFLPSTLPASPPAHIWPVWILLGALWSLCSLSRADWMLVELAVIRRRFCRETMTNKGRKRKKRKKGQKKALECFQVGDWVLRCTCQKKVNI